MGASASSSSLHSGEATSKSKTEETSLLPNKNEHKKDQRDEPKDEPWFACDLAIIGPGLLVSLADTEFASLMEAANSGARFKFSFQMGLQLLLIPVLFLTQELTVRLGAHTQKGHGACIREVYGPAMSWFCFLILSITCILATMTELAGIVGVAEICGLDPTISVCVASLFMIILIFFCPYRVVEKVAVVFGSFELSFVVAAFLSRPRMDKFWPGLFSFDVPPELAPEFAQMAAANIGAVIVPWMIYFQQSAVAANGVMSGRAEAAERTGTLLGSTLTQIIMVATMVAFAATRDKQHGHLNSIDDANAMNQVMMELFGDLPGRVLCTLGIVGGSVCAAIVVALANSWALVDALGPDTTCIAGGAKAPALPGAGVTEARRPNPMDLSVCEAPFFYAMYAATVLIGFIIIMSGVSQEDISVAGLLTNALFMPPTLLFLWLLATGPKLPETTRVKGFYKWITAFAFCLACTFSTIELVLGMTDTPGSGLAAARARKRSHRSHVVLGSSISNVETRASKPHIIIMLADDLGYANVGWNNAAVHTPQLNALVADGVRLERHYVYQFCSPSRASLMTGRYPIHVQERMGPFWSTYTGPPTTMTLLPAKLREAQYRVHHVGKWHLGAYSNASIPVGRGFETSFGFLDGMQDHWNHRMQGCNSSGMEDPQGDSADLPGTQWECWGNALPLESCDELSCYANLSVRFDRDLWRDRAPATALDGVFSQDMYEAEARNLIASHDLASPLFLYLAFQLVHGPIQTPKRFVNLYDAATHPFLGLRKVWGFVTALDESIGRIVGALKVIATDGHGWPQIAISLG
jgi:Mn2+/Fe2+ NRAMP family transporter